MFFAAIKKARNSESGFTLIELLIVVIILAILAAIVVFAVGTTGQNAAVAACNSDAKSIQTALEAYKVQVGTYPAALSDLTTTNAAGGPWLKDLPGATNYMITYDGTASDSGFGNISIENSSGSNALPYDGTSTPCSTNASS